MLDINKVVTREEIGRLDPNGYMYDLEPWSPHIATQRALAEGLEHLDEDHWMVIYCLRERYREQGPATHYRDILRDMEQAFADRGGRRYLYELFPRGPVSQGCRLAGIPSPAYSSDASFGWSG